MWEGRIRPIEVLCEEGSELVEFVIRREEQEKVERAYGAIALSLRGIEERESRGEWKGPRGG